MDEMIKSRQEIPAGEWREGIYGGDALEAKTVVSEHRTFVPSAESLEARQTKDEKTTPEEPIADPIPPRSKKKDRKHSEGRMNH